MVDLKLAKQRQQDPGTDQDTESPRRSVRSERFAQAFCDLLGLCGLVSIGFGLYQVHPPSMYIICGALVLIGALLAARN